MKENHLLINIWLCMSGTMKSLNLQENGFRNGLKKNKLGISVSKKVGNSIVRHRLTRQIREIYRLQEDNFICGIDIVVIVRNSAKGKNYHEIQSALLHLGNLHNVIRGIGL